MQQAEDFYNILSNAIFSDIWCSGDNEFAGPWPAAGTANEGKIRQQTGLQLDLNVESYRRHSIVEFDVQKLIETGYWPLAGSKL